MKFEGDPGMIMAALSLVGSRQWAVGSGMQNAIISKGQFNTAY